jgi:acetoin utilization deacetylase AcuC-like enzyme
MNSKKLLMSLVAATDHILPGHPESPLRFQYLDRVLEGPLKDYLISVPPIEATKEQITRVHTVDYLERIEKSCSLGPGSTGYDDTYWTRSSMQAALLAAGSTLAVVDSVLDSQVQRGFAIVRPPGHHATRDQANGFCFLNNIAIAAKHCQTRGFQRVMIIDFDVHHGNGTQDIFDPDPDILYLSTHQYGIYPGTGAVTDTGIGQGKGSSVNIPLPAYSGDHAFESILERIIQPIGDRFQPEMLLVSAGYDAHWEDPLATLSLSASGFYALTRGIIELANRHCGGKLVFVLEGGYNPRALTECIEASLLALCELSPDQPLPLAPRHEEPDITALLHSIQQIHALAH